MDNEFKMLNMSPKHHFVISNLEVIIKSFIKNENCVVLREARYDWDDIDEEFEPDISLLCGVNRGKRLCYNDVPRFIAEVLSDSTEQDDRNKKMKAYARVGVEEYWLIDWRIPGGRVERYLLDDNGEYFLLHDVINGAEQNNISLILFPVVSFTMTELMEHIEEDMCDLYQCTLQQGRAEGKAEGIVNAVKGDFMTKENAAAMLKIGMEELEKLLSTSPSADMQ